LLTDRVVWHQGGQQSRQATNAYVLHPPRHSEFNSRTVFQGDITEILYLRQQAPADLAAAEAALTQRRQTIQARLLERRGGLTTDATCHVKYNRGGTHRLPQPM